MAGQNCNFRSNAYHPDYDIDMQSPQELLTAEELLLHIRECASNNRESQKKIYCSFYGYAMAVCDRYINNPDDAVEILNDGFLKIFKEIHHFSPAYSDVVSSFKGWLRKIMIYTAIDHFRKNHKHSLVGDLNENVIELPIGIETPLDKISYDEIIRVVQQLSPAYRTVFNLFVIEGMSHDEIARLLGISTGTSKSNLSKARRHLQRMLLNTQTTTPAKNAI